MIKFKQKEYVLPLALLNTALTGGMIAQGISQGKEEKEQAEEQQAEMEKQSELMAEQNRKLEKLATVAKGNPEVAEQTSAILQNKQFANIGTIIDKSVGAVKGFMRTNPNIVKFKNSEAGKFLKTGGQAVKNVVSKPVLGNLKFGVTMGVGSLAAGSYIHHDMKKNNLQMDENGNLAQRGYSENLVGKVTKPIGKVLKSPAVSEVKGALGSVAGGFAFSGLPTVLQYKANKQALQDQIGAVKQKSYAIPGIGKLASSAKTIGANLKNGWNVFRSHPAESTINGISKFASFGVGGKSQMKKLSDSMINYGKANNSRAAIKTGLWMKGHRTATAAITVAPAIALGSGAFDAGSKVVNKVGRNLSPGSYEYQDAQNKQVNGNINQV